MNPVRLPLPVINGDDRIDPLRVLKNLMMAGLDQLHDPVPVSLEHGTHGIDFVRDAALINDLDDLCKFRADTAPVAYWNNGKFSNHTQPSSYAVGCSSSWMVIVPQECMGRIGAVSSVVVYFKIKFFLTSLFLCVIYTESIIFCI